MVLLPVWMVWIVFLLVWIPVQTTVRIVAVFVWIESLTIRVLSRIVFVMVCIVPLTVVWKEDHLCVARHPGEISNFGIELLLALRDEVLSVDINTRTKMRRIDKKVS